MKHLLVGNGINIQFDPNDYTTQQIVLGLSPWNDFHIFEAIDQSAIESCTFYYFSEEQCQKVISLLPRINQKGSLHFSSAQEFWRTVT